MGPLSVSGLECQRKKRNSNLPVLYNEFVAPLVRNSKTKTCQNVEICDHGARKTYSYPASAGASAQPEASVGLGFTPRGGLGSLVLVLLVLMVSGQQEERIRTNCIRKGR